MATENVSTNSPTTKEVSIRRAGYHVLRPHNSASLIYSFKPHLPLHCCVGELGEGEEKMNNPCSSNNCPSCTNIPKGPTTLCTPKVTTGCFPQRQVTGVLMPTIAGGKHMCLKPSVTCGGITNTTRCKPEKLDECQVVQQKIKKEKVSPPPQEEDPCAPIEEPDPCAPVELDPCAPVEPDPCAPVEQTKTQTNQESNQTTNGGRTRPLCPPPYMQGSGSRDPCAPPTRRLPPVTKKENRAAAQKKEDRSAQLKEDKCAPPKDTTKDNCIPTQMSSLRDNCAPVQSMDNCAPVRNMDNCPPVQNVDNCAPVRNIDNCPPVQNMDNCAPVRSMDNCPPIQNMDNCAPQRSPGRDMCTPGRNSGRDNYRPLNTDNCAPVKDPCTPQRSPVRGVERNYRSPMDCSDRGSNTRSPSLQVCTPPNLQKINCPPDVRQNQALDECAIASPPPPNVQCINQEVDRRIREIENRCTDLVNTEVNKCPPGNRSPQEPQPAPRRNQQRTPNQCTPQPDNCSPQPRTNNNGQCEDADGVTDNSYCQD